MEVLRVFLAAAESSSPSTAEKLASILLIFMSVGTSPRRKPFARFRLNRSSTIFTTESYRQTY